MLLGGGGGGLTVESNSATPPWTLTVDSASIESLTPMTTKVPIEKEKKRINFSFELIKSK